MTQQETLCLTIRKGLTKAYNAVLAADEEQEHPITVATLDDLEKAIEALDKLERAFKQSKEA